MNFKQRTAQLVCLEKNKIVNDFLDFSDGFWEEGKLKPVAEKLGEKFRKESDCFIYPNEQYVTRLHFDELGLLGESHSYNTRNRQNISMPIHKLEFYKKKTTYAGGKFYNNLPDNIKKEVGAALLLLVLLYTLEEKPEEVPKLRYEVYSHLDKMCRDVNALDKIQIAIYFLMQSWLTMCDSTPDTMAFAPLKFMKKRIHDAVTKKIHDFHKKDEQTVEDCIITYYNTEIKPTDDDFHQMLFEMILQGYMRTFNENIKLDETKQFLKMETLNCKATESCQYSFPKPPSVPQMIEVIVKKSQDNPDDVREKKCIQIFQHLYLWNEKIKKPELFEWAYFLLFKGVEKTMNMTEIEVKKNLHCGSSQMQAMEKAITAKPDEINPFLVTFLRERDTEIEILEDELEYAEDEHIAKELNRRLTVQEVLAELVLKTYLELFNMSPTNGRITVLDGAGPPVMIEIPPMETLSLL